MGGGGGPGWGSSTQREKRHQKLEKIPPSIFVELRSMSLFSISHLLLAQHNIHTQSLSNC